MSPFSEFDKIESWKAVSNEGQECSKRHRYSAAMVQTWTLCLGVRRTHRFSSRLRTTDPFDSGRRRTQTILLQWTSAMIPSIYPTIVELIQLHCLLTQVCFGLHHFLRIFIVRKMRCKKNWDHKNETLRNDSGLCGRSGFERLHFLLSSTSKWHNSFVWKDPTFLQSIRTSRVSLLVLVDTCKCKQCIG